jgi:hypothetical protein
MTCAPLGGLTPSEGTKKHAENHICALIVVAALASLAAGCESAEGPETVLASADRPVSKLPLV